MYKLAAPSIAYYSTLLFNIILRTLASHSVESIEILSGLVALIRNSLRFVYFIE